MGQLERYVSILRLFTDERPQWTVPSIAVALVRPTSTVYRTVRELLHAKFLETSTGSYYRLGACFVEFDRLVRVTDPLCAIGASMLPEILAQARLPCTAVLARLYGDTVMCVASQESADGEIPTSYERGRPRPLTRGATSKTILAQLPQRRLIKLLKIEGAAEETQRQDESALREELAAIRKNGFCITRGEVDPGLVGIAAPVVTAEEGLVGSLSIIVRQSALLESAIERRIVLLVVSSAALMSVEVHNRASADARRADGDLPGMAN